MTTHDLPLIPLELFFRHPEYANVRLSPDGRVVAFLRPWEDVPNLWVQDLATGEVRRVTDDRGRGILEFAWAYTGELIYLQDQDGDENWRLYALSPGGGEPRLLTPGTGVQARLINLRPDLPDEMLVALNDRNPALHDVYRVRLSTGERELVMVNEIGAVGFLADERLQLRVASRVTDDGGGELLLHTGTGWAPLYRWGLEDVFVIPQELRGETLYLFSSVGRNTSALVALDLATGEERLLAEDPEYDMGVGDGTLGPALLFHPRAARPEAVAVYREKQAWIVLDPSLEEDFERLARVEPGRQFGIFSRDLADRRWVVAYDGDRQSLHYYLYDRETGEARLLFVSRPELERYPLAERRPVRITARDGLVLHGYLTLPPGAEPRGLPAVLYPHGGPWARDFWGWEPIAQWLANRGYAVLQVNFRGSVGYGKAFVNAGNKEWGGKMQDDLTDAVRWLVEQGIADPERVAIMGGSYGGYATLAGMTFTPELYRCGVDIVGPSNLFTLLESLPPYWKPMVAIFHTRMGHPERDAELLRARSPLFHAERIRAPLLIGQGANDPRVKRQESLQIVEALRGAGKEVEYVEYADEGHGFFKPENRLDFFRRAERFLARHLGGRCEPEPAGG